MIGRLCTSLVTLTGLGLFCLCPGCTDRAPEQGGDRERADRAGGATAEAEPSSPIRPGAPETADKAVRAALDGLNHGHPEALWDFLPPLLKRNINSLVHEFGRQMDAELWSRAMGVAKKLTRLLETRQDAILASPFLHGGETIDADDLAEHWPDLVGLLNAFLQSEFADVESLKSFDGRVFLAGNGSRLLGHLRAIGESADENPFAILEHTQVTLVQQDENRATVRLEPPDEEAREVEFVIMERQWAPAQMFEWNVAVAAAKAQVGAALRPDKLEQIKTDWMPELERLEQALDELQQTQTTEEFNAVLAAKLMPIVTQRMLANAAETPGPNSAAGDDPSGAEPGSQTPGPSDVGELGKVTVVIRRELDAAAEEQVATQLLESVDNADYGLVEPPVIRGGETQLVVSPVGDVRAFADRIQFGTVVDVQPESRRIVVEWMTPADAQSSDP